MSGWEMAPHVVNGEKTFRAGATFVAPFDEHYYGLGQNQEGILDYRGRTTWKSNVGERVSYFVIVGATTDELYAGYRKVTGTTPLPPKAAFGYIQSKARYETQQQVLAVADGYRSRGYPLDVMVVDWFYWTRMGQLDIDARAFPDPRAMNQQLHAQGVHSIISVAAFREGIALLRFSGGARLGSEG